VAAPLIVLALLGSLVGVGLLLAPKVTAQLQDVPLLAGAMVPIKLLYVQGVVGDDVPVLGDDEEP
jgi:hypothetical protein